jgi:raffinose/stachyose/melibiose transport system permease protein
VARRKTPRPPLALMKNTNTRFMPPGATSASLTKNHGRGGKSARSLTPYLYILPGLILVVGIIYVGIGYTGWASTLDWDGIGTPVEIGLSNFAQIAGDPIFWATLGHMVIFGIITIFVQMVLGLVMAIVLSGSAVWGKPVYKVIVFIPVVLAPAVIATAFREIFAADGQFNQLLHFLGLGVLEHPWLADPRFALYALVAIQIWEWTGFSFILYQAAITQVDPVLFEAAQIDGAGNGKILRWILIPQLKGTHATLVLLGTIGLLKTFDIVYLTTGGGPAGTTQFLATYIYQETIDQFHAGYASALSIVLLLLSVALTLVQVRINKIRED